MTIDQAFRLVNFVANKEQGGNIVPAFFNELAIQCQLEAILERLGNQKRLGDRYIPSNGLGINQQANEDLLTLFVRPTSALTINSGIASYPPDYFAYHNLQRLDGTLFTVLSSDEMGRMRKSLITPPVDEDPFVCFHADGIEIRPETLTDVYLYYIKRPRNPNWDYSIQPGPVYVYNNTSTPQLTGSVSYGFDTPERLHKEIVMRILKYIGVNLDNDKLTVFSSQIEQTTP